MVTNTKATAQPQLCALVSKANGEEPIGSAATFDQCLVIEVASPWPRDAMQAEHVPSGVLDVLARVGKKVRPQAILPDPDYSTPGYTRVIHYRRPPHQIRHFEKQDYVVPETKVTALVTALLEQPNDLAHFAPYRQDSDDVRELLVCTHGARDTCCGKFGVPIYQALRQNYAPNAAGKLRVWRTSHTGGHRFASTLIDFPHGHYWGRVELSTLDLLVHREGDLTKLNDHYRGWSVLSPLEQVVEREIWLKEGWHWLNYQKTCQILAHDADANRAEIEVTFSDGSNGQLGRYTATVEQYDSVMTLPSSGTGPLREEPLYRVSQLIQAA